MNVVSSFVNKMEELEEQISENEEWFNRILNEVGWDRDLLLSSEKVSACPLDSSHIMPSRSLDDHATKCRLFKKGYSKEELNFEEPSSEFFYTKSTTVVPMKLDSDSLLQIVSSVEGGQFDSPDDLPHTMSRSLQELSAAQRLAVYEHCVMKAKEIIQQQNINKAMLGGEEDLLLLGLGQRSGDTKPKSRLEILAEQRDLKRRRQSYRGKSTATNKKSHNEVIREVIENQMELLGQMWEDERREKERESRVKEREERDKDRDREKNRERVAHSRERDKSQRRDHDEGRSKRDERSTKSPEISRKKKRSKDRDERSPERSRSRKRSRDREERSCSRKRNRSRDRSRKHSRDRSSSKERRRRRSRSDDRRASRRERRTRSRSREVRSRRSAERRHRSRSGSKNRNGRGRSRERSRDRRNDERYRREDSRRRSRSYESRDTNSNKNSPVHNKVINQLDLLKSFNPSANTKTTDDYDPFQPTID